MEEFQLTDEEMDLLLFTKEEEEFMVVPTLQDSPIRLEDLMSEETFSGLTVDTLQNPSGVFVVDVDQTSGNHNSIASNPVSTICDNNGDGQNIGQQTRGISGYSSDQQFQYYQQQPFSYAHSDNSNFLGAKLNGSVGTPSLGSGYVQGVQYAQQYSELADPTANWVAQATDVTMLERLVSESERFRTVDDLLDIVPADIAIQNQSINTSYQASIEQAGSPILDKNQILEEIYREAEEISSRRDSPAVFSPSSDHSNQGSISGASDTGDLWERITSSSQSASDQSMDSYHPPQSHLNFDHVFGFGSDQKSKSKKSKVQIDQQHELKIVIKKSSIPAVIDVDQPKAPKREVAKQKKRHQNREAALRYRLKKRAEKEQTNGELSILMQRNESLKQQVSSLGSEIAYLKGLLSEVHKKKQIRAWGVWVCFLCLDDCSVPAARMLAFESWGSGFDPRWLQELLISQNVFTRFFNAPTASLRSVVTWAHAKDLAG